MDKVQPPQQQIETLMESFRQEMRWEAIYLFSSEGLPLAGCGESGLYNEAKLLELVFSLPGTAALLEGEPVQEIMLRGTKGRRMVFRYLTAWGDPAVLVAVVYARRGFQRAMGQLIRLIESLD